MKTEDLIGKLVNDVTPVKPVRAPLSNLLRWVAVAFFCVAVGIATLGIREDFQAVLRDPVRLSALLITLLLGIASALSAFVLSVPGPIKRGLLAVPLLTALGWVGLLLYEIFTRDMVMDPGTGMGCVQSMVLLGVLPGILLFNLLNKGAPLRVRSVGLLGFLASAAFGAFGSQLTCIDDQPAHLLVWHVIPVLGLAALGLGIGKVVIKKSWL